VRVNLVNVHLFGRDAVARCLVDQARFLLRRGDDVRIYTSFPPRHVPHDVAALAQVVDPPAALADPEFTRADVHVFHYPGDYALLETLPRLSGRVVLHYHNVTPPELWGSEHERELLVRSRAAVAATVSRCDLVLAPSPFNVADLVNAHGADPSRVRLVPLGVDLERFRPGPDDGSVLRRHGLDGRRVVLFVGRLAGNKRADLLVEALALVRPQVPDAALLLVGDQAGNPAFAEVADRLRTRADALGIGEAVRFAGSVEDVPAYYRVASVYASASLHEGFGVPLVEAMASGLPVVASRAASHPWVLGGAGLLASPGDASALAEQLVLALTDEATRARLVDRGLARARELSLPRFEARFAAALDELREDATAARHQTAPEAAPEPAAVAPRVRPRRLARGAEPFEVVALIAAYNEADVIGEVVEALVDDGVHVYFIDNHSTDGTVEEVRRFEGRGVIGIETFPDGATVGGPFEWERILRRKEALASELDADWFVHHDADEFRESPWPGESLREGIRRVDALGYNAIDFAVLNFRPTTADPADVPRVRERMRYYERGGAHDRLQVKCWKNGGWPVALAASGGHEAEFPERRVFPVRFLLRHYPIRSQEHGERKVFEERQPRFVAAERERGWHVQYDHLSRGTVFVRDPATLVAFEPDVVRFQLIRGHREMEAAEAALAQRRAELATALSALEAADAELGSLRHERETLQRHLAVQDEELERLRQERQQWLADAAERHRELDRLHAEVASLDDALAAVRARLADVHGSASWRLTAPLRALGRRVTGR
jgi:glycosyltransferase involved in cell wall biosynthesis